LPSHEPDPTVRAHALARTLLDRHGVVTRGAVAAEGVEGGFSATYRILSVFEESGQARRGYVVEGLGAAQFAMDGAVDRLRAVANARDRGEPLPGPSPTGHAQEDFVFPDDLPADDAWDMPNDRTSFTSPLTPRRGPASPDEYVSPRDLASPGTGGPRGGGAFPYGADFAGRSGPGGARHGGRDSSAASRAVVLAAADPANAYGAALGWPEPPNGAGHKPGRKAGSLVVLVDGELTLYMERGGKSLLAWPSAPDGEGAPADDPRLHTAAQALAEAARAGALGTVTVERVNGGSALTSPIGALLEGAGFIATPRGLRLRA
ncbi:DEAD/DEAH box helicase, partial [Streptomyces sp. AK04-3B]|nr:DEAD/DEAH box helicase [Streptomyces sp. AK04-3B]